MNINTEARKKNIRIALVGASGYSGAELARLLLAHPNCGAKNLKLFSSSLQSSYAKKPLQYGVQLCDYAEYYPAFYGSGLKIYGLPSGNEWPNFFADFDIVFLATPHAASVELAQHYFRHPMPKLIDLSGALRLSDPQEFQHWYGIETLGQKELACCEYGLSELFATQISNATVVANPGCYATAVILALAPLAERDLLSHGVRIDAKSGLSGAGKTPSTATHFAQANESLSLYKPHCHQHIPEIEMALRRYNCDLPPLTLTTHLLPLTRGIMATCYIQLPKRDNAWAYQLFQDFYRDSIFVRIRKPQSALQMPQIQDVSFSNRCDIGLAYNQRNGELVVVSVLDNLLKGAAGQAIQNMNLLFGLCVEAGLPQIASLP